MEDELLLDAEAVGLQELDLLLILKVGDLATDNPTIDVGPGVQRLPKPFRSPEIVPLVQISVRH